MNPNIELEEDEAIAYCKYSKIKKPHHYDEVKRTNLGVVEIEQLTTKYCELSTGVTTPSRVWGWMTRLFCPYLWEKTSVHPSKIGKELTIPEKCHFFSNASV